MAVGSTLFALTQGEILRLMLRAISVRAPLALVILLAVVWRRIHPSVAFWTIVLGCGSGIIWFVADSPFGVEPLWPALTLTVLTLIIGSLIKKPSRLKGTEGLEITLPES